MDEAFEQRWASVPPAADPLPLREDLLVWFEGTRGPITDYIARQATPEVIAWLDARAVAYGPVWPQEPRLRWWYEAAADLAAWQRRKSVEVILGWLRDWDLAAREVLKGWPA